jgi:glutamyl-tRNA synthetase
LEKLVDAVAPFWSGKDFDLSDKSFIGQIVTDMKPRAKTLVEMAEASLFYFQDPVPYDAEAAGKFLKTDVTSHLDAVARKLPALTHYSKDGIEQFLRTLAEEEQIKLKIIAQPLRVALTGKTVSPGIDEIMVTLGKDRVIRRIRQALDYINTGTV